MKRLNDVLKKPIIAILFAIILGVIVGAIVFTLAGFNSGEAYSIMINGIITKPKNLSQAVVDAVPLIFTGLAFTFSSQAGLFNIGVEGQFVIGALVAAMMGYYIPIPSPIHPIIILLCAFFAGGLLGGFSGLLKTKFGIHEVISTIMLNWIAHYLNNFIVNLPAIKVEGTVHSPEILDSARINFFSQEWRRSEAGRQFIMENKVLGDVVRTDLGYGIFIALVAAIIIWYFLKHTTRGYEIRAVGLNRYAAEFSGIPVDKNTVFTMFIAGGTAALGGAILVMTSQFYVSVLPGQEGYGWDGMSVALIANTNPLAVLPSALFFAALKIGGNLVQSQLGAPTEIIKIIIGVIVLAIAVSSLLPRLADKLNRKIIMENEEKNKREIDTEKNIGGERDD